MNRAPLAPIRLNPNLPPKLEDVINRALEKDRDLRYQHAVDIKSELLRLKRDLDSGGREAVSSSSAQPADGRDQPSTLRPVAAGAQKTSGSAESGRGWVVRRRRWLHRLLPSMAWWKWVVPLAARSVDRRHRRRIVLAQASQALQLTDKDLLILADFTNQTGDAVFDSTLKEALAIQLEQSPMLQLVSDAEMHSNLQYLGQAREQRITPELAQQLGQRLGVKAFLAGTIASLGSSYVISINAVNCATGEVFAREQVIAPTRPGSCKRYRVRPLRCAPAWASRWHPSRS